MEQKLKSNIEITTIDNFEILLQTINENYAYWPNYIFRGQGQSDWLLEPTLSRVLKKIN